MKRRQGPILVVDDESAIRDSLRELFEEEGFSVLTASNGTEALDLLGTHPNPCVVVLDLMMPGMDGHDFFQQLQGHALLKEVPIIVITAGDPPSGPAVENAFRVYRKPFKVSELLSAVMLVVDRHQAGDAVDSNRQRRPEGVCKDGR